MPAPAVPELGLAGSCSGVGYFLFALVFHRHWLFAYSIGRAAPLCRKTCTPAAAAAVAVRFPVWERAGTGVRAVASTSSKINSTVVAHLDFLGRIVTSALVIKNITGNVKYET